MGAGEVEGMEGVGWGVMGLLRLWKCVEKWRVVGRGSYGREFKSSVREGRNPEMQKRHLEPRRVKDVRARPRITDL